MKFRRQGNHEFRRHGMGIPNSGPIPNTHIHTWTGQDCYPAPRCGGIKTVCVQCCVARDGPVAARLDYVAGLWPQFLGLGA